MRSFALCAACAVLLAVFGCEPNSNHAAGDAGSVVVTGVTAPDIGPRDISFAGAVSGTSQTKNEACETAGTGPGPTFTVTAGGELSGRTYFLYLSVYGYAGPHVYELRNGPTDYLYLASTPTPKVAPGYPGFLNFVPKYKAGNAFGPDPRDGGRPLMAVDAGELSGWFDVEMISLNGAGPPARLAIKGRFICGPAFEI
jgi:hypothetical protein